MARKPSAAAAAVLRQRARDRAADAICAPDAVRVRRSGGQTTWPAAFVGLSGGERKRRSRARLRAQGRPTT